MFETMTKTGRYLGSFATLTDAVSAVNAAKIKMSDEARIRNGGKLVAKAYRLSGRTYVSIKGDDTPYSYCPFTDQIIS